MLKLLDGGKGGYLSGGVLARQLEVSRSAVWKTVESLRSEGYIITAVTNKGYRLESGGDILSEAGIMSFLKTRGVFNIDVRKSVTSTNIVLRELAAKGAPEWYVVAAGEQTAGKGRMGREFHSPAGNGAYFSLLLRPADRAQIRRASFADATLITSAASVAVARAISEVTGIQAGIKWVNDIFVGDKKVCGILTEATVGIESGMIENAVLGIGINVTKPENGYPEPLRGIAGSLADSASGKDNERCRLIAATLDNFREIYLDLGGRGFLSEYRSRSTVIGKDIFVLSGAGRKPARAMEIDDDCRLIVRYESGEAAALGSGEISVRPVVEQPKVQLI